MKRRFIALIITTLVGGSLALTGAVFAATSSGQANGDCKMGYYTSSDFYGGGASAAATINLNKSCVGPVEGRFTTEIQRWAYGRPAGFGATEITMVATCTGTGGFTSPCTVGQQVTASPGPTTINSCDGNLGETCPISSAGTRSMNMVWPSLLRGVWRFDVLATLTGVDGLSERTFTVEAFIG